MPRVLTLKLHDGTQFKLPIPDANPSKPVLRMEDGWTRAEGTDGQVVLLHYTALAWAHAKEAT